MVQEFHAFGMAKIYIQNSQALPIPLHRGVCCTGGTAPEGNAIGKDITWRLCRKKNGLTLKVQRGKGSSEESSPDILNQQPQIVRTKSCGAALHVKSGSLLPYQHSAGGCEGTAWAVSTEERQWLFFLIIFPSECAACEKYHERQLQKLKGFTSPFQYLALATVGHVSPNPPRTGERRDTWTRAHIQWSVLDPIEMRLTTFRKKVLRRQAIPQGLSSCSPQHLGITEPNLNFPRAATSSQVSQRANCSYTHYSRKYYSRCPEGILKMPKQELGLHAYTGLCHFFTQFARFSYSLDTSQWRLFCDVDYNPCCNHISGMKK